MEFRDIPDWPGYQASDTGEIKGRSGRLLRHHDQAGYRWLTIDRDGKSIKCFVHVLVCEAWHGRRPAGHEVAHGNGVRSDNRPTNLSWKTRAENHFDKRRHGTHVEGEQIRWSKLTESDVREIKALSQLTTVELGRRYGVTPAAITHIRSGRNWKHIT